MMLVNPERVQDLFTCTCACRLFARSACYSVCFLFIWLEKARRYAEEGVDFTIVPHDIRSLFSACNIIFAYQCSTDYEVLMT